MSPPTTRNPIFLSERVPDDVVFDILTRLPVKSLIRFRCVSISWNSIITNPIFITTHFSFNLNQSKSLSNNTHNGFLQFSYKSSQELCTVVCNSDNTLTHVSKFQIPILTHRIAAFCNGLFCLANYDDELSHIIYLWNPSVRKFKKLIAETRLSGILDGVNFGLAYHPQNNDFKLLRLVCYGEKPSSVAEIYTLSTDSWRKVMLSGETVSGHFGSVVHLFKSNTVFCNGALHSMSFTHQHNYILAFDVDDESFRAIMLPQNCFDGVLRQLFRLAVFKGSLAFIVLGRDFNDNLLCKCDIWVMWEYGVDESWTRIRVPMDLVDNIYCCTDNGEILIRNGTGLVSFELESRNENIIASDNVTWVGYTANCMESLVLLDGVSVSSSN